MLRFGRASEDVVIFSGDLNCTQTDFAYRLVKHNGALIDSYIDSPVKVSHRLILDLIKFFKLPLHKFPINDCIGNITVQYVILR